MCGTGLRPPFTAADDVMAAAGAQGAAAAALVAAGMYWPAPAAMPGNVTSIGVVDGVMARVGVGPRDVRAIAAAVVRRRTASSSMRLRSPGPPAAPAA